MFLTHLQNIAKVVLRRFKYFFSSRSQNALITALIALLLLIQFARQFEEENFIFIFKIRKMRVMTFLVLTEENIVNMKKIDEELTAQGSTKLVWI